ncbi:MAG: sugar ABC transporter substrate-binding protein [Desulfobulbaceae bacterium]|nr:sugar ABC transporter substrate-binding protein [Desulfobulbaceae bacterium]
MSRKIPVIILLLFCLTLFLSCTSEQQESDKVVIEVWYHTGRPEEKAVFEDQVSRFNRSQNKVRVALTLIPEGDYNTQVMAAAAGGSLPDLLDVDGPYMAGYAWNGHLRPIDDLLPEPVKQDLLPSIIAQGSYKERLYAVGTFDSGLGLYANREKLAAVAARIPQKPEEAWSIDEFERILADLSRQDDDGQVLDIRLDYRGEWQTYAFAPILQSAGGDLIDRRTYGASSGILNGPESVAGLQHLSKWLKNGYIDPNIDTAGFTGGKVALSWCGHWEYHRYRKALSDKLLVLPLPDFGRGSKTGMGSWCWAVTSKTQHPREAMQFLLFLLRPAELLAMSEANGAVPATMQAISRSSLYGPGGPLHLFVLQLQQNAVPRPQTPGYPVITSAFQQAFQDIRNGADVKTSLDRAVEVIDQDIQDNEGYGF